MKYRLKLHDNRLGLNRTCEGLKLKFSSLHFRLFLRLNRTCEGLKHFSPVAMNRVDFLV